MAFKVSDALSGVRLAMADAAQRSERRRLRVYGDKAPCAPGCSGCCSRMVTVTVAEATIVLEHLIKSGSWPKVRELAVDQAKTSKHANGRSWFLMNIPCAVLDRQTKRCLAYSSRPTPCSVHFATSSPGLCDPWSTEGGTYEPVEMADIHAKFLEDLARHVDGYGVLALSLPMPAALLLAERVRLSPKLTSEDITAFIRTELT
jgi:Fe-S-cluster containining protein